MDFQAAVDYILSFADYERMPRSAVVFDLRRIELLLGGMGSPQYAAKSVHIAGTKGKGSTAAMIASILTRSGYRTGLYTSPHLLSIRERIQVDGQCIPEDVFARLAAAIKPEAQAVNASSGLGQLTTFELLTALAFLHFREQAVDFQVVETGLGGRLDATNVVRPEVCVITSVSYDHMDVLGDTLASIAKEKAGVIKTGSVAVTSPQAPEAMAVIEAVCREKGVRLVEVGREVTWQRETHGPDGQSFKLKGLSKDYDLSIPLLGAHQLENAATAVAVAEVLAERGAGITGEHIAAGLAQVQWPGRMQVLHRKPWFVVDGAHNSDSSRKLVAALREYFVYDKAVLIFGASSDKNVAGMVDELASFPDMVIVTHSHHPRALDTQRIIGEFARKGVVREMAESVPAAIERALSLAGPDDLVCATGSLFIVAEVMEYMRQGR